MHTYTHPYISNFGWLRLSMQSGGLCENLRDRMRCYFDDIRMPEVMYVHASNHANHCESLHRRARVRIYSLWMLYACVHTYA